MMCDNIITLKSYPDIQWSVRWVRFPAPIGTHPAIVLTNERWIDGTNHIVVPVTSTRPMEGKRYGELHIPITLEPGRVSYIKLDCVTTVDRSIIGELIGYVPFQFRDIIMSRYIAVVTGGITGISHDGICGGTVSAPKPVKRDLAKLAGTDARRVTDTTSPVNANDDATNTKQVSSQSLTLNGLKERLGRDMDHVSRYRDMIKSSAKMTPKTMSTDDIIGVFITLVRDNGYKNIVSNITKLRRFNNLLNELYARNIIPRTMQTAINCLMKTEYSTPVKREWDMPAK